ncbi:MAG: bifunctional riboflavin kinase/FAD synthetase [Candidatus Omnitrophica bacterium]|nr:bifunctional riboflavin kinase/FAD synthetase [Candidatus Omnitrophota bacterium]
MIIFHGINQLRKFKNPVAALGVFDGLHLGHRQILQAAARRARQIGGTSIAMTFWPHPQKEEAIYSLEHRLRLIALLSVDACIVINFTPDFGRITPEDFIKKILVGHIGVNTVYVGKNFRFGRNAKGDFKTLEKLSRVHDFKVKGFSVLKVAGKPISSTYIRRLIKKGRLEDAQKLLGRPVSILGTVIRGNALGRWLGYATSNINPHHEVIPPCGVYAVRVVFGDRTYKGVCYIGSRPTLGKRKYKHIHVEVHILDFARKIYGRDLEIRFLKKIRGERKFSSLSNLIRQIAKDIKAV